MAKCLFCMIGPHCPRFALAARDSPRCPPLAYGTQDAPFARFAPPALNNFRHPWLEPKAEIFQWEGVDLLWTGKDFNSLIFHHKNPKMSNFFFYARMELGGEAIFRGNKNF